MGQGRNTGALAEAEGKWRSEGSWKMVRRERRKKGKEEAWYKEECKRKEVDNNREETVRDG